MYHINPLSFSPDPININLGDLAGDFFWDMQQIFLAFGCSDDPSRIFCSNAEFFGRDIVVTKVIVEILALPNAEMYGPYALCNICTHSGESPVDPSHTCEPGTYVCDCIDFSNGGFPHRFIPCNNPAVGREDTSLFGKKGLGKKCEGKVDQSHEKYLSLHGNSSISAKKSNKNGKGGIKSTCAMSNAADLLGGYWYSTLDIGLQQGTWRTVEILKRVRRDCHSNSFLSAIEARGDTSCFESCNDGGMRNISNLCYVQCFADVALGPYATNSTSAIGTGGMTKEELIEAWVRPFESSNPTRGGCPNVISDLNTLE